MNATQCVQTTLCQQAPIIIDTTCSFEHERTERWPKHATFRIDKRRIVKPDIVADARYLPFKSGVVDQLYCDPPHMYGAVSEQRIAKMDAARLKTGRKAVNSFVRYSWWDTEEDWLNFVKATDIEFHRVLKNNGLLFYKITDGSKGTTKLSDLELMTHFDKKADKETYSLPFKRNIVHWLTFSPLSHTQPTNP